VAAGRGEDYQCDVLFHGLRSLLGENAVDVNRIASLYEQPLASRRDMYGRGFTVYGNLPDIPVDRENVAAKIRARHFDLIVYGSIHRCQKYLREVQEAYPRSRIVYIDGEDETTVKWRLLGKGVYFKRELRVAMPPYLQPIHFAVPLSKFIADDVFEDNLHHKSRAVAHCDPRDRSTYIFETEEEYYQQYRESFFGVTTRKAGWDCMRHHEIVSQGTAPLFIDLEACPEWTLHRLPRTLLLELRGVYRRDPEMASPESRGRYVKLMRDLFAYYKGTFTTTALAMYVLDTVAGSTDLDRPHGWPPFLQTRYLFRLYARRLVSTISR
jgi:hypothetical protein